MERGLNAGSQPSRIFGGFDRESPVVFCGGCGSPSRRQIRSSVFPNPMKEVCVVVGIQEFASGLDGVDPTSESTLTDRGGDACVLFEEDPRELRVGEPEDPDQFVQQVVVGVSRGVGRRESPRAETGRENQVVVGVE